MKCSLKINKMDELRGKKRSWRISEKEKLIFQSWLKFLFYFPTYSC
jgi:hypothetical protein